MATTMDYSDDSNFKEDNKFWNRLFSVIGPFDIYGGSASDPLLRSRRELVIQIFRLIDYPENLQVSVAAMHAIADMAESPMFSPSTAHSPHKIYSILSSANELNTVMELFIRRLEREETEEVSLLTENEHLGMIDRAEDEDGSAAKFGLANIIRLQILNFLIKGISKTGYGLAHYLLGFGPELLSGPAQTISTPAEGTQFTCFHIILELLTYGLGHPSSPIISLDHPSLGHKCYELLCVMLSNPLIGRATVTYLRENEDFYRKQLLWFSRALVDPNDFGYTVYETLQRAYLIKGAMLDLHFALVDDAWSYAKKLSKTIVSGVNEKDEEAVALGSSVITEHFSILGTLLSQEYLNSVPELCLNHLKGAANIFANIVAKLSQLIICGLDRVPYDQQSFGAIQLRLVSALIPLLSKLSSNVSASPLVQQQCGSILLSICGLLARSKKAGENGSTEFFAGDEVTTLVAISFAGICRADSTMVSRGYFYSAISELLTSFNHKEDLVSLVISLAKRDLTRIVEATSSDLLVPAIETAGWKAVSANFLTSLLLCESHSDVNEFGNLLISMLTRSGSLKNIITSTRLEDPEVSWFCDSDRTNALVLWKSKMLLIQSLAFNTYSTERLVEVGIIDVLSSLKCLQNTLDFSGENGKALYKYWVEVVHPVIRLLLAISNADSTIVTISLARLIHSTPLFDRNILAMHSQLGGNYEGCFSNDFLELISRCAFLGTKSSLNHLLDNLEIISGTLYVTEEDTARVNLTAGLVSILDATLNIGAFSNFDLVHLEAISKVLSSATLIVGSADVDKGLRINGVSVLERLLLLYQGLYMDPSVAPRFTKDNLLHDLNSKLESLNRALASSSKTELSQSSKALQQLIQSRLKETLSTVKQSWM